MTDPTTSAPVADPVDPPAAPPAPPAPAPAPASRAWVGVVAVFMVVALLAGVTAVLFVRVQEAQDTADDAVVLAGGQDALADRIDDLDATLAALQTEGSATAEDVAAARDQVSALRKCVNNAIDAWAQATQSGKPVPITKC